MSKFSVLIAYNVPCYGEVEIEAKDQQAAERKASLLCQRWANGKGPFVAVQLEPEWSEFNSTRVVDVQPVDAISVERLS